MSVASLNTGEFRYIDGPRFSFIRRTLRRCPAVQRPDTAVREPIHSDRVYASKKRNATGQAKGTSPHVDKVSAQSFHRLGRRVQSCPRPGWCCAQTAFSFVTHRLRCACSDGPRCHKRHRGPFFAQMLTLKHSASAVSGASGQMVPAFTTRKDRSDLPDLNARSPIRLRSEAFLSDC